MKKYADLINQTFDFPTREFKTVNNSLYFNDIPLMELVQKYGTPLKITYLPRITERIQYARQVFGDAMRKYGYEANYIYCYCTKSSHFKFILEEVLKNDVNLETSSAYDIDIMRRLYEDKLIDKDRMIICNGFKRDPYKQNISALINEGFKNVTPVLDNLTEIDYYLNHIEGDFKVGIRCATDEEPTFDFYTSRLGIRYNDIVQLYKEKIAPHERIKVKVLHFFISSGIRDTDYYWSEFSKFIHIYCELKKLCPDLDSIDIGGGFPIISSLASDYDHQYMAEQIVENIQQVCQKQNVPVPNLITEFGNYTVGESGAIIYSIAGQKLQNDKELWYMIDGSFITQIPDTWAKSVKFVMLPVNHWDREYRKVHLGGTTCDSDDYYTSEYHNTNVYLPVIEEEPLYVGFFHTGAYQDNLGGLGGVSHCLIPSAKHVIINRDAYGRLDVKLFRDEQGSEAMLKILGYVQ